MSENQLSEIKYEAQQEQEQVEAYLSGFTEQERIVLDIAQQHLETSFDISKSIGFLAWKQEQLATSN